MFSNCQANNFLQEYQYSFYYHLNKIDLKLSKLHQIPFTGAH